MSIQNSGEIIRHARITKQLTQQQLAEGICKVSTLSQIENGTLNASTSIFDALMSRMGVSYTAFPSFKNRMDFDCFYALKRARFYIDSWQLSQAYEELDLVEQQLWAKDILHYTEWILLHGKLQFLSGCCNHEKNFEFLLSGLQKTHPTLQLSNIQSHLLSKSELEFLILIAETFLSQNKPDECISLCKQIDTYLKQARISYLEKNRLIADNTIVMGKYYLFTQEYETALSIIHPCRLQMRDDAHDMPLLRLTFLEGLASYFCNDRNNSIILLKTALYSSHAMESCYHTICINYLENYTDLNLNQLFPLQTIPLKSFMEKMDISPSYLSNGTYDIFSPDALTLGQILRQLREEQQLSQEIICHGLCSKSALSKIERNQMQPDIFLMEALLQRLGISERIFTFYGNSQESLFYDLKFKSMGAQQSYSNDIPNYIKQLEQVYSKKNTLQKQFILLISAVLYKNPKEQISLLFEALFCTLPDFDISRIHDYRLSWAEWNCINNIAHTYLKTNTPSKSIYYFNQLMSYLQKNNIDCILYRTTYLRTFEMFCHALYNQKYYTDTFEIFSLKDLKHFKTSTNCYSFFLFYYCQILGECNNYELAHLYGNYACALSLLNHLPRNAIGLSKGLFQDFSITLDILN